MSIANWKKKTTEKFTYEANGEKKNPKKGLSNLKICHPSFCVLCSCGNIQWNGVRKRKCLFAHSSFI